MDSLEMLSKVKQIREELSDDQSREIYDIWIKYFIYRDIEELRDDIMELDNGEYIIPALDRYKDFPGKIEYLVLFGGGRYGRRTLKLLQKSAWGGVSDYNLRQQSRCSKAMGRRRI